MNAPIHPPPLLLTYMCFLFLSFAPPFYPLLSNSASLLSLVVRVCCVPTFFCHAPEFYGSFLLVFCCYVYFYDTQYGAQCACWPAASGNFAVSKILEFLISKLKNTLSKFPKSSWIGANHEKAKEQGPHHQKIRNHAGHNSMCLSLQSWLCIHTALEFLISKLKNTLSKFPALCWIGANHEKAKEQNPHHQKIRNHAGHNSMCLSLQSWLCIHTAQCLKSAGTYIHLWW